MMKSRVFYFLLISCVIPLSLADKKHKHPNKYSAEANVPKSGSSFTTEKYDPDFRTIQKPFRMAKLNLVWAKAQHRLTEPKLKSLYTELKIQDKEEIAWKQLNSQHKDKDGLKEAELRKKLIGIMSTYDLLEHFDDTQDPVKYKEYRKFNTPSENFKNKSLFKDKKLNKLWEKAEISGFTPEELKALKEEFEHHQNKIDIYYSLLEDIQTSPPKSEYHHNAVNEDELEPFNEILQAEEKKSDSKIVPDLIERNDGSKDYIDSVNLLRVHHREIRDNFDRLERLAAKGPNSQDFIEPKVQGLWRIALASNLTADELSSIKTELHHFESRLLKLRNLHAEHALHLEKHKKQKNKEKRQSFEDMEELIKKQSRKVEKIQDDIEKRIFKHTEL